MTLCFSRTFESELRMYDGDDPLDVWDRSVKYVNCNMLSLVLPLNLRHFIFNPHVLLQIY